MNEKTKLENIYNSIKIGHNNAINPPKRLEKDFADYIDNKNYKGDVVIRSHNGYYRPFPMDDEDSSEFSKYIENEYQKGMHIIEKCNNMVKLYSKIEETVKKKWEELYNA